MPTASISPLINLVPLVALFAIFYFLIILPQQRKQKKHQEMLNSVKRGDRVLTTGGLYGMVVSLKGSSLELKVAENVKVEISKNYIQEVLPPEERNQKQESLKQEVAS